MPTVMKTFDVVTAGAVKEEPSGSTAEGGVPFCCQWFWFRMRDEWYTATVGRAGHYSTGKHLPEGRIRVSAARKLTHDHRDMRGYWPRADVR